MAIPPISIPLFYEEQLVGEVNILENKISLLMSHYHMAHKILPRALSEFNGKRVFSKIDPYGCDQILFCYKNEREELGSTLVDFIDEQSTTDYEDINKIIFSSARIKVIFQVTLG